MCCFVHGCGCAYMCSLPGVLNLGAYLCVCADGLILGAFLSGWGVCVCMCM